LEPKPKYINKKLAKQIKSVKTLTKSASKWLFWSEEASRFRKRRIPSYLLKKDSGSYPCYVC